MLDWLFGGPLEPGAAAPQFELSGETGQTVSLLNLRNKPVVLVFYPGDDTTICTRQLCEIRDGWAAFRNRNAAVFGINGQGADAHIHFKTKYQFPFPLLIDKGWKVSRQYRAGWGIVRRTVYVIGPDGRIVYAQRGKPPIADILSAIEGIPVTS
ncbi:MAG: peroxiredoxin [Acidobacteria bacterium]|nr:peroxiredoxin [Acidobacteriota bacterium]